MTHDERLFLHVEGCSRPGVYCVKCRFRMLPSSEMMAGDKMYYCFPCAIAIGVRTGMTVSILSLVKKEILPLSPKIA